MASPRTNIDGFLPPHVSLPSRLIPGGSTAGIPRRKILTSVAHPPWRLGMLGEPATEAGGSFWSLLAEYFQPEPTTRSRCPGLVLWVAADVLLIVLGFAVVNLLFDLGWMGVAFQNEFPTPPRVLFPGSSLGPLLLYGAMFALLGYSKRLYHRETLERPRQERIILAKVLFWSTVWVGVAWAASSVQAIPAFALAAAAPLNFLLLLAWRNHCRRRPATTSENRNVLIVGAGSLGRRLAAQLEHAPVRRHLRGFLDEHEAIGGDILGRLADLAQVARREFVDEIILTLPPRSEVAQQAIWCMAELWPWAIPLEPVVQES